MKLTTIISVALAFTALAGCQSSKPTQSGGGFTSTLAGDDPTKVQTGSRSTGTTTVSSNEATKTALLTALNDTGRCMTLREYKALQPDSDNAVTLASLRDLESQGKVRTAIKAPDIFFRLPNHGVCF
ncbi:MAG: hypothetical protein AAGG69_08925 [Pseudomonadota bacterium]